MGVFKSIKNTLTFCDGCRVFEQLGRRFIGPVEWRWTNVRKGFCGKLLKIVIKIFLSAPSAKCDIDMTGNFRSLTISFDSFGECLKMKQYEVGNAL
ncbi:hypothetical protein C8N36_105131 [Pelagimonas varians]|uniref:Uncharacterized protein n=1 Tax=Pelagimonas varians TaxID=696760 RepID=A0A238KAW5_9RHOB|nr:hypothetical protein C8N36_105131 [Pelagimonas varians]SMX39584.1 hypothetical protein PEV8663_01771 [Pelagimonas varians]